MTKKQVLPPHKEPSKPTAASMARKRANSDNRVQNSVARQRQLSGLKPFQPGQSGNPGGRPRKIITEGYEEILREVIVRGKKRDTRLRHMLRAISDEAIAGKIPAIAEITDRVEGKAMQAHELSGPGGGAIPLTSMSPEENERRIAELLAKGGM